MELLVEQKRRVLKIVLNRPEKRNALTSGMCSAIVETVEKVQESEEVGSILLCANGPVFCAGMDLDEASAMDHNQLSEIHADLFSLGVNSKKPIVIAVCGAALGGGLGLVAQGHVVAASAGAAFALPEIHVGLWPFLVYHSIEAALGPRRTLELSLTGRLFHAQDALDWGLVHSVCNPGEVFDRAKGIANDLAKASPAALRAGMQYFHESREKSREESAEIAKSLRSSLMETDDFKEGYEAFKHKREPHWPSMPQHFYSVRHTSHAGNGGSRQ
jgi:enoyl-CoA hydratase/carnithine racemase